ncbi:ATP-binding protein [Maribacter arenosus]|uniref:histidine kinase n=1 Tax=Maribacter arenosus TaxID=1854708 RepID=A0ABR7VB56_9FLAO|nr:ATP-binding protein [Maribacter arenosus]MBD0849284.1 nuclear transport factor 2 family protein [Maribacter arenosus]
MKLTNKKKEEILKIYDTWMHSYLNGDVITYDSYFADEYHFIGSTDNEEFLNRKDTTQFFKETAEQFSGKTDLRNETTTIEAFDDLIFITHIFDAWFINGTDWTYYGRFRFSSVLIEKKEGWKFIYQHFSIADSKTDEGESIGFDKVNEENQELREAIKRRTVELEAKNRELEIEGALERIRAQAVAMQQSSDLLDIVVTMRNEFTKLGHEAHYFWHMMWLPETYEKAMTSGDGSKIGFVMELPRHMHGDIPLLAKWEKSNNATVVYAMNAKEAIDYVDKMVNLGDFQNIDPQAPTHEDIKHIGGLTFVMARTTHGEIGYSLPGVVKKPPAEDIDILIQFASAFDLAHRRFLDLQKAEKQAREVQIELALEKVRSRTMGMQRSDELRDTALLLFQQVEELGINSFACGFNIWDKDKKFATAWMAGKDRLQPPFRTNSSEDVYLLFREAEKRGDALFVLEQEGKVLEDHYKYLVSIPEVKALAKAGLSFPTFQIIHCAYFKEGYLMFITHEPVPNAHDIFIRFAKVFEQTYTRFLDLQKAEAQARESEIELALERVRARTMAMQHSDELQEASYLLDEQVRALGVKTWGCAFNIYGDKESTEWFGNEAGILPTYSVPRKGIFKEYYEKGQKGESIFIQEFSGKACIDHYEYMSTLPVIGDVLKQLKETNDGFPTYQIDHVVYFKYGYLLFITKEHVPDAYDIFKRFAKVFEQTYTRFLDLQKAEAQAREAQIEAALERTRTQSMLMQHSNELNTTAQVFHEQLQLLGIDSEFSYLWLPDETENNHKFWATWSERKKSKTIYKNKAVTFPLDKSEPSIKACYLAWESEETVHVNTVQPDEVEDYFSTWSELLDGVDKFKPELFPDGLYYIDAYMDYGCFGIMIKRQLDDDEKKILNRFSKEFQRTYTRFLDLQKAEAQAREAQIETALEKVRSQSLAMHSSDEMQQVANAVYDQLKELGLVMDAVGMSGIIEEKQDYDVWIGGVPMGKALRIPYNKTTKVQRDYNKAIKERAELFARTYTGKTKEEYIHQLLKHGDFPKNLKNKMVNSSAFSTSLAFAKNSGIQIARYTNEPYTVQENELLKRFAKVFEQAYIRFMDLQKAEAQTREAQIEAALEKVRSRTMAMQKGIELQDVVVLLYKELIALGVTNFATCGYVEINEETQLQSTWVTSPGGDSLGLFYLPLTGDVYFNERYEAWKKQQTVFHQTVAGKERRKHLEYAITTFNSKEAEEMVRNQFPDPTVFYCFNFSHGYLHLVAGSHLEEEEEALLARFTRVFEQTYARFLDLEKAEAQAREAQINLAVERVRAKALAMHKSEEIMEVVAKLKEEVMALDIPDVVAATIFLNEGDDKVRMWDLSTLEKDNNGYQIPFDITFKLKKRDPNLYVKRVWENPENYFIEVQEGKDLKRIIEWLRENNQDKIADEVKEYTETTKLERLHHTVKKLNNGKLVIDLLNPPSDEMETILTKMGGAFDLAYKRFEDLQKAEAQTREAQIEAALEKVRSRSLAMHKPDELQEVVAVVAEKLKELGVIYDAGGVILCTYFPDNKDVVHWIAVDDFSTSGRYLVPYFDNPIFNEAWDSKIGGDTYFSKEFPVEAKNDFFEQAFEQSDYKHMPEDYKQYVLQADKHRLSAAWSKNSAILIPSLTGAIPSESDADIMKRFAKVFEQAYIRFMDLQKAEAQAREAQIEAALEKVRSRTMAMHKSKEMLEVIGVVSEQLQQLNLNFDTVSFAKNNQEGDFTFWITSKGQPMPILMEVPTFDSPILKGIYKAQKEGITFLADVFSAKVNKEWHEHLIKYSDLKHFPEKIKDYILNAPGFARSSFLLKNIDLYVGNYRAIPFRDEENAIFKRFAHVFEQSYTRFLDLQKAEAQAREAQIENALEKVRSRTMAMQQSHELPEAANNLFLQVQELGIPAWSAGYCIWENEDKKTASCNMSSEGEIQNSFILPTIGEGYNFYDPLQSGETFYVEELGGDALVKHYDFMRTLPKVGKILEELIKAGLSLPTFQIFHIVYFPHGYLMFITYEPVPDAHEIFKRFAKVFEQTYTRFLDLQKAEAQAREATKQASLDRVRGQIASMRSTADLDRITPLLWNELTTMGVPFIRCGVFIIDEPTQNVEVYLSAPNGHSLGVLHLQFNADPFTENTVAHWRKGKIFKEHWNREEFLSWTQSLMERGQISDKATYQGAVNPPDSLNLHFIPFTQGMLYVGSENPLNVEQIELVQSLADAFAIAYARYEDFTKLEKAKQSVEITLSELKATQNQLVQSEKMASLGELTAGIAHEIQNPLNFVNNFSEVSNELIDEMNEEIAKGDLDEAKAIADDIKQNLEKINHHGKRADAIVKGMLQHSRSSSGVKEPTDINALADEYLRLAYHGLRAKDKGFNATMNTDFDDTIGKIKVVPQDIGRVILNLITNAFYVVDEKKKSGIESYEPTVSIRSKKKDGKVEISVKDNGNGIPQNVLDKIFQPFFTTKPTGQGTGLGLSMSYDIITKGHGGELKVETKEGEGTTFAFSLPNQG